MNLKINSSRKKNLGVGELTQGTVIYFFSLLPLLPSPSSPSSPPFPPKTKNLGSQRSPEGHGRAPGSGSRGLDHLGCWFEPWAAGSGGGPPAERGAWALWGRGLLRAAVGLGKALAGQSLQTAAELLQAPTPSPRLCSLSPTFLLNNQGLVLAAEGATELAGRGGGDVMDS